MKINHFATPLLAVMLVNSCTTYYYVKTDVAMDLAADRSVYASSADIPICDMTGWNVFGPECPPVIDFHDVTEKMSHAARKHGLSIEAVAIGKHGGENPLLCPEESVERRFRWFYTYYDYRAVFASMKDRLPLPFDGYLSDAQLELFLTGDDPPEGWNGVEMYYLLDDISRGFAKWYSDAVYSVMCDIFKPFCTKEQAAVLDTSREVFIEGTEREALFAMKPVEFDDMLASVLPDVGFGQIYEENAEEIDEAYERKSSVMDCFETSFVFAIDMPGKYVEGNAVRFIDGSPSWKADAYRLMYDDLVLEASFRKVNLWAFILTFASIAVVLQIFAKVFAKSRF